MRFFVRNRWELYVFYAVYISNFFLDCLVIPAQFDRYVVCAVWSWLQILRRINGKDTTIVDDRDPLTNKGYLRQYMCTKENRVILTELANDLSGFFDLSRI